MSFALLFCAPFLYPFVCYTDSVYTKVGVKLLIFVTVDSCRSQLEGLTQLLFSAFPGSTVYQHTDLCRVPHDISNNKVDAVFVDAEMAKMNSLGLIQKLRMQKPELPVFIISKSNEFYDKASAVGASGYFVLPDSEHQLLETIRLVVN